MGIFDDAPKLYRNEGPIHNSAVDTVTFHQICLTEKRECNLMNFMTVMFSFAAILWWNTGTFLIQFHIFTVQK